MHDYQSNSSLRITFTCLFFLIFTWQIHNKRRLTLGLVLRSTILWVKRGLLCFVSFVLPFISRNYSAGLQFANETFPTKKDYGLFQDFQGYTWHLHIRFCFSRDAPRNIFKRKKRYMWAFLCCGLGIFQVYKGTWNLVSKKHMLTWIPAHPLATSSDSLSDSFVHPHKILLPLFES